MKGFNKIPDSTFPNVIIGGDFNCLIDPVKDAQPSRTIKSKSAATLQLFEKSQHGRHMVMFKPISLRVLLLLISA